jgi:GTP cyclohydrolase IA
MRGVGGMSDLRRCSGQGHAAPSRCGIQPGPYLGVVELVEHGRDEVQVHAAHEGGVLPGQRVERAIREHDDAVLNPRFVSVTGECHGEVVQPRRASVTRLFSGAEPTPVLGYCTLHRLEDGGAVAAFLTTLGVATDGGATADTPHRMARAYTEMLSPRSFDLTTFANDEDYNELVLARGIPVHSVCEHHMLPFLGTAHVGYLPGQRILGLSKLARVVELFARRPQVQERLTKVADWLQTHLRPRGVGVVIEAEHLCMTLRGVRAGGTSTITSALLGTLREDLRSRAEFLALTGTSGPHGGRHG